MKPIDPELHVHSEDAQALISPKPGEVVIGTLSGLDPQGQTLVDYPGNPTDAPLLAVSTQVITQAQVGRQAALLFANGDPRQPVVLGLIQSPLQAILESYELTPAEDDKGQTALSPEAKVDTVTVDGKRILLEGKEEIVLKCGDASITLTRAGKILIRGKYLLNRSEGVNRIMGGSVQVN